MHGRRRPPSRSLEIEANSNGQQRASPETPISGNCYAFEEEGLGRVDFSDPSVTEVAALIVSSYEATFGKQMMMPGMPDDLDPSKVTDSLFLDPGNAIELLHTTSAYIILVWEGHLLMLVVH